ncbi:protein timeless-like [Haliotis cracherodii]|uniref:protein timeless-like n=1 Tax=Haliotis cracherodii TaxID=6455 RepID=UPI0039EBA64C
MEWSLMNPIGLLETEMGFMANGIYFVSDECKETLQEMLSLLLTSDGDDGEIRQKLGQQDIIRKDLLPLLMALEEDSELFEAAIELLSLLTQPLSLGQNSHLEQFAEQTRARAVLTLLKQADDVCWSVEFFAKIKKEVMNRLEMASDGVLNPLDCETINYCLLLIRNLFYFGETDRKDHINNFKLRMIFESGLDKMIMAIIRHPQKMTFTVSIVQILSFLYKDNVRILLRPAAQQTMFSQPIPSVDSEEEQCLQAMANMGLNQIDMGGPLSPTADLEDPTVQRRYITAIMDTMELNKPKVDEVGVHHSSHHYQGLQVSVHCNVDPSLEDVVGQHLTDLAQQFLADGYAGFIGDLLKLTLSSNSRILDNSYLLWSISFFLRFARQQALPVNSLVKCLDGNLVSYLVYIAVDCCEKQWSLQRQKQWCDLTQNKLHLTVLSLMQLFRLTLSAIEDPECQHLITSSIKESLMGMTHLREVFLLLLRQHRCPNQGIVYLRNLICANHHLLLILEKWGADKTIAGNFSMLEHVKKFATVEIMAKYGQALESFEQNENDLNECILTMMHHIAGDCNEPHCLMQLSIMRTFSNMLEQKHLLSSDFSDLIEYVLEQFMIFAEEKPLVTAQMLFGIQEKETVKPKCNWSSVEEEVLMSSILSLTESDNIIADLKYALSHTGFERTEQEIEEFIKDSGWLQEDTSMETVAYSGKENTLEEDVKMKIIDELSQVPEEDLIHHLVLRLKSNGHQQHLTWLQENLFEAANAKNCVMGNSTDTIREPVTRICSFMKKDIPLIFVTEDHEKICHNVYFFALLNTLDLKVGSSNEQFVFPRVPYDWTTSDLIQKMKTLGPVPNEIGEVDRVEELAVKLSMETTKESEFPEYKGKESSSVKDVKLPDKEWMSCVQEANKYQECQQYQVTMETN